MDGSCENLKNTGCFLKKTQRKRRTQPIWFYYPQSNCLMDLVLIVINRSIGSVLLVHRTDEMLSWDNF